MTHPAFFCLANHAIFPTIDKSEWGNASKGNGSDKG
jgi:hypothetical protein